MPYDDDHDDERRSDGPGGRIRELGDGWKFLAFILIVMFVIEVAPDITRIWGRHFVRGFDSLFCGDPIQNLLVSGVILIGLVWAIKCFMR